MRIKPTAEKTTDIIHRTPADRIEVKLIPKRTLLIDSTLTPVDRPERGSEIRNHTNFSSDFTDSLNFADVLSCFVQIRSQIVRVC